MGYYPPSYLIPKYFKENNINFYKIHLGYLNFDNDANFLEESKTEPNIEGRDYKVKPSPSTSTQYYHLPLANQWRYFLNQDLPLADRQNAIQKVPGLSGNAIKLITVDSGSTTVQNTTPIIDFNSYIDWSWSYYLNTEFDIQTPDHDSIIFQSGLFCPINKADSDTFYDFQSNNYFSVYSITIYFKNGKYYCMLTRVNNSNTFTPASNFIDESLISTMSDSVETIGGWNHITVLNTPYPNVGLVILFNDKICFKIKGQININGAGWSTVTAKYSYDLQTNQKITYSKIKLEPDGTESTVYFYDDYINSDAYDQALIFIGSGISNIEAGGKIPSSIKPLGFNTVVTKTNISKNINVVDYKTDQGMDKIEYVKDPIPKGTLNLSFDCNIGDSLVYDNIEVYKISQMAFSSIDLYGKIIIQNTQNDKTDINGTVKVQLAPQNKDLQGKLFTRPRFNNDIDGSIYIIDWYNLHELNGTLNIRNHNDSNEFPGTIYIPKERSSNLNGALEIYWESNHSYLDGQIGITTNEEYADLQGTLSIDNTRKQLPGKINIRKYDSLNELSGSIYIPVERSSNLDGIINIKSYNTQSELEGQVIINSADNEEDLNGSIYINNQSILDGQVVIRANYPTDFPIIIEVPQPEIDLPGSVTVRLSTNKNIDINIEVPNPEIDFPGSILIRKWIDLDPFEINIRVPVNVKPEPYEEVDGDFIIEIPFPYPQFTDTQFFLTQVKYSPSIPRRMTLMAGANITTSTDNLFIPQRYYSRYDERHLVFSNDLGLQEGDEIRFTFCHNDAKFHIQKMEFYFKAQGNASFYYLDMLSPYKKTIENSNIKFRVFVNRREIVLNKDYTIDNEAGILEFMNDDLAQSPDDRIDVICFYTGIDDTAIADLPMSGYIYLKRNMIDRNYNNNLMATFINGKLIPRDKILHISNNIYKIKENIKTRHDLQILNMSNRINSMVPFYKQSTNFPFTNTLIHHGKVIDNFHPKYTEKNLNISITVPALTTYGRQHFYMYHNPVFFDPHYLLDKKDYYIAFMHVASHNLLYELNFYNNDTDPDKSTMNVILELHIKTPFEDILEESRSTILLTKLPATIVNTGTEYVYASIKIKQIINLDIWNNRFLEMCDGVTIRIEPERTYQDQPSELYFDMTASNFEDYEKEQITVFEIRISDKYDGLGQVLYSKFLTFNPEESNKEEIKEAENNRV